MSGGTGGYAPLIQLLQEIGKAQGAGANVAALALVYIGIDTMTLLSCPAGKQSTTRLDFVAWVDKYLKADRSSAYQYEGGDVYAARFAVLGGAPAIQGGPAPRKFVYADSGPHKKNDADGAVQINVATLVVDFSKAMQAFIADTATDAELKKRVDSRIGTLFFTNILGGKPKR